TLNHPDRPHARNLLAQPRPMNHIDHLVHILVRLRLFLRESLAALRPRNDAASLQFLVDAPPARVLHRCGSAHRPACSVARRAERPLHAARLTDQHPTRPAHVAGNDHWLADLAVHRRQFRMARRECSRRSLPVDPHPLGLAADGMLLELGDVVTDVVDQVHLQRLPLLAEDVLEDLAGLLHQQLPVAPGIIRRRPHGADVVSPLRAVHRRTRELTVGQLDAVLLRHAAQHGQGVVAHLVAEAARAAVDHHADHVLFQPQHRRGFLVEDLIDDLHFEEVVARAERAALLGAAGQGEVADVVGHGTVEAALGLGVLDIAARRQAAADQVARALGHELPQLLLVELVAARAAGAGGDVAEEIIYQRADLRFDLAEGEIGSDQTYPAVDIVAYPPRRY